MQPQSHEKVLKGGDDVNSVLFEQKPQIYLIDLLICRHIKLAGRNEGNCGERVGRALNTLSITSAGGKPALHNLTVRIRSARMPELWWLMPLRIC